jgi:DNA/RNA endonuclease G (NUC1)
MKANIKYFVIGLGAILLLSAQAIKDIKVKNQVFEVNYSQTLEQPLELTYRSTNRPTNVNRGSMDFWTDQKIKTSDGKDYEKNVYDKGHLAPAATFSDNMENLKTTFSYLNCALQNQYLNRGEWRLLEEQERKWDDKENLTVKVTLDFNKSSLVLSTGATVPNGFTKHIYFESSKKWECYYFPNSKPEKKWSEHKISCSH